jgi:hypothetical protein
LASPARDRVSWLDERIKVDAVAMLVAERIDVVIDVEPIERPCATHEALTRGSELDFVGVVKRVLSVVLSRRFGRVVLALLISAVTSGPNAVIVPDGVSPLAGSGSVLVGNFSRSVVVHGSSLADKVRHYPQSLSQRDGAVRVVRPRLPG